ncbi:MAG: hypothetical protein WCL23_03395 [Candidatus Moraniibacteriota bacterium]
MAYLNEKEKIIGWESFRGTDNRHYLKSKAMQELLEKSSRLAFICKSSGKRKTVFDAMIKHAEEGKGLRAKGFLLALGDLYGAGQVSKGDLDIIIREIFPSGIEESVKRMFVYREPTRAEVKTSNISDNEEGESEASEEPTEPAEKKDKGIWNYLPF